MTWKTTCVPNEKLDKIRSFVACMPDLQYVFYTDSGIMEFLSNYSRTSGVPGMAQAVSKMAHAGKWRGIKLAEMARGLLLEHRGGLAFDLDVSCRQSWGPLLDRYEALMALEPRDGSRGRIYKLHGSGASISKELSDFSSTSHVLSSVMAAARPHTRFFKQLANYTARTINGPTFRVEAVPVENIGPMFHYHFLGHYFASHPPASQGAVMASYLLHVDCRDCPARHHGGCTWCNERYQPTACTDIRRILPADKLTIYDGQRH